MCRIADTGCCGPLGPRIINGLAHVLEHVVHLGHSGLNMSPIEAMMDKIFPAQIIETANVIKR
jgi:hypothetical protein